MTESVVDFSTRNRTCKRTRWFDDLARRLVRAKLGQLRDGRLLLVDGAEEQHFGRGGDLQATVQVRDPRFYRAVALGGSLGAAEAYMDGHWETDDLTALCRIVARNGESQQQLESGWARFSRPAHRLFHALRRNSPTGSRRNIAAHYDLGNDFFRLFLDETMMYSCAVFPDKDSDLAAASVHKNERICRKLDLKPEDHLLEIGTGWGGFALHAAGRYGCRITTTTISREQCELAQERVCRAGLQNRIEILLCDYRDLEGRYDKLVSIEMIEAVGHPYFDTYFRQCSELLEPNGLMLLQAITISDWAFEAHKHTVDFIKRYIFPGSCIPSIAAISDAVSRVTNMRLFHLEDIGPHYARTLREWRTRFSAHIDQVRAMGFPEEFIRMWEFYLCYCEAGFTERYISDAQLLLAKPGNRRTPLLPELNG